METAANQKIVSETIAWLHGYANERINSLLIDERRCIPPYVILDLGNRGLFGICVPKKYSGMGLGLTECCKFAEALSAIDPSISSLLMIHNVLGIYPLMNDGKEPMKEEYLPLLAQGRILGTLAYTEPGAGANANAISAKGEPLETSGGWRLNGKKTWIGNASWSGLLNIFIKVRDPQTNQDHIAGFAIPQGTSGMTMGPEALTLGVHGMVQNSVILENVLATDDWLLGELSQGKKIRDNTFNVARLLIGACCLGVMKRSLQMWMRYAGRREISTGLLLNNAVTLMRMSECAAMVASLESLIYPLAEDVDNGKDVPKEMNVICKIMASEWGVSVVDKALQGIGGRAYVETSQLPQLYRDIRLTRIFEGPTETLLHFVGISFLRSQTSILGYLKERFAAEDIGISLRRTIQEIKEQKGAELFSKHQSSEWTYWKVAQAVCRAVVWAAVRCRARQLSTAQLQKAEQWAYYRYSSISHPSSWEIALERGVCCSAELEETIHSYANVIGDVEQSLAGADYKLDPMLKRSL